MTDNVCDSWEDVDVDNIVVKPINNVKGNKNVTSITYLASQATNSSFNIEENNGNIVVNDTAASLASNPFKIMQRAPPGPTGTSAQSTVQSPFSYSAVAASASPFESQPKVVLEDSTRTQFVAKLRILNRPNSKQDQAKDTRSNVDVNKQLMKSFEEKQAEYAKARLRILGEEMPAEELNLNDITDTLNQISVGQTNEKATPSGGTSKSSTSLPNKQIPPIKADVIIIREPIAPDNTRGFKLPQF